MNAGGESTRERKSLGEFGERVAAAHLEAKGYRIIERNFRVREAEIDLVACDGDTVVFVEVRTRRGAERGLAVLSVNARKARQLLAAAGWYAADHPDIADREQRIDVVAVELARDGRVLRVEHIENAVRDDR